MIFTGLIHVFGKTGRALKVSSSNKVILSEDGRGASTFQVVGCRAWDVVSEELRPRCVSLMDANRMDWYVRHRNYYLRVDPENDVHNLTLFDLDSSFIVHSDTFYTDFYALESFNYPECAVDNGVCGPLASCINTTGSFDCTCLPGYTGDGFICTSIAD